MRRGKSLGLQVSLVKIRVQGMGGLLYETVQPFHAFDEGTDI